MSLAVAKSNQVTNQSMPSNKESIKESTKSVEVNPLKSGDQTSFSSTSSTKEATPFKQENKEIKYKSFLHKFFDIKPETQVSDKKIEVTKPISKPSYETDTKKSDEAFKKSVDTTTKAIGILLFITEGMKK